MEKQFLIAGFGGQGVLLIGQLIAKAAMLEGREVSWMPSYGPEMRGGEANCAVVVSDEQIGSPLVSEPPVLVAMLVGLTISILQATTQIQEQTLTFVPKLFAIVATLALSGAWMLAQLIAFTASIYDSFATYVR